MARRERATAPAVSFSELRRDAERALGACSPGVGAAGAHAAMVELLEAAGERAFHRGAFSPGHFTASAFVVDPDGGELLLILHAKLGRWLQPGGHVDAEDATLLAAARRELAEETGLTEVDVLSIAPFDLDVHLIPAGRAPAHLHFDVRFLLRARARGLRAATDAVDARWVPLADVVSFEQDASVLRAVVALERARELR